MVNVKIVPIIHTPVLENFMSFVLILVNGILECSNKSVKVKRVSKAGGWCSAIFLYIEYLCHRQVGFYCSLYADGTQL